MTPLLQAEWTYRYQERLGILAGPGEPTDEQKQIAAKEADEAIKRLTQ